MTKREGTKHKGQAWWSAQVAAWRSSNLSQQAFCKRRGLSQTTFSRWRHRLTDETSNASALVPVAEPRFVAVELPAAEKPLVRVSLGTVTVDFETLPPPAWIAELAARGGVRC